MNTAPPIEPPHIFKVMSAARIRSHLWSLFVYGTGIFIGIRGIRRHLPLHRSIVFDVIFLSICLLMFLATSMIWIRDQGSQIIIQGNKIELNSGNGDVRAFGLISDIAELKAAQRRIDGRPWSYSIIFANRRRIVFDRNIPNLDQLVALIEKKTGLQFVVEQS